MLFMSKSKNLANCEVFAFSKKILSIPNVTSKRVNLRKISGRASMDVARHDFAKSTILLLLSGP